MSVNGGLSVGKREEWLVLSGPYAGLSFKAWINYPSVLKRALNSEDNDVAREAFAKIISAHNGWTDHDGTAIPQPNGSDPGFWDAISDELLAAMVILMRNEAAKYPTSLLPKQLR